MIPNQLKEEMGVKYILLKPKDKLPMENNWQKDNAYTATDPRLIEHINSGGNYGVRCGGGLIVMDADTPEFEKIVREKLPVTFEVKTSKGIHFYYFCMGFDKKKVLKNGDTHLGEIQSTGTFVVGANSIHPTGAIYTPNDIPIFSLEQKEVDKVLGQFYSSERINKEVILKGTSDGVRNESMFKLACSFRSKDLEINETFEVLKSINAKNNPPLSEPELVQLIKSAYKYKKGIQEPVNTPPVSMLGEKLMVFNEDYIAMAEKFWEKQPYYYDKSSIWWLWNFEHKYWEMVDEIELFNMIRREASPLMKITKSNVFAEIKKALKLVGRDKRPQDAPKKWIQFKETAFSLKSKKTYEVKPNYFFTNPIPWKLGKVSDTPTMDKLFKEWVGEKYLDTLYEIISYCCYSDYPIQVLFCLYGGGRNGKSCFLRMLSKFIGSPNLCSTDLDLLVGHNKSRFESFKLYRKLACLLGETNFGVLDNTTLLKKLTGGDMIGYEIKGKLPFDDYNYAKILIASNSLPSSEDTSEGFYRRWVIIDFPNQFKEGKDIIEDIPDIEYENLARKVTEILPKLLEKGEFTNQGTIEERRKKYVMASNPLPFFIEQCCMEDVNYYERYSHFYLSYVKFLTKMKRRVVSKKEFSRILIAEGYENRKTSKEGEIDYYIEGLKIKKVFPDFPDFQESHTPNIRIRGSSDFTEIEEIEEKTKTQDIVSCEKIYHRCSVCGTDTADLWHNGKPVCNFCGENLAKNGEKVEKIQ